MRALIGLTILGSMLFFNTGCMTAVKRAYKEGKGASSKAEPVRLPGTELADYTRYKSVQIVPPRTNLGNLVTPEFKSHLVSSMRQALVEDEEAIFKGGSPTLTIEPEVMWYHRGGIGGVFPEKFAVVLFWMKEGNNEIGRIQIVTKSEAARTEDDALAESAAGRLAKYLKTGMKDDAEDKEQAKAEKK